MERILLGNDLKAARRWFSRQRGSKAAVIAGFLAVMLLTAFGAFSISFLYFRNLSGFGPYGYATAAYLLHAAVLVVSVLATGSAVVSTLAFLLGKSRAVEYLKALPLDDGVVLRWQLIKGSIVSTTLVSVLMIPVLVSYALGLRQSLTLEYLVRSILLVAFLMTVCQSIGGVLAFAIAPYIKRRAGYALIMGIFGLLGTVFLLLKLIFPVTLARLYFADAGQFWQIYNSLPLSNSYIPTLWFTLIAVSREVTPLIVSGAVTLSVAFVSYLYQRAVYTSVYQDVKAAPYTSRPRAPRHELSFDGKEPLFMKDVLSIWRLPSEVSYVFFLIGLAAFFFLLILYTGSFRYARAGLWGPGLLTFCLGWLLFFTTAFLLRLVFPLMARERPQAWYMFTLPLSSSRIVIAKVTAGLAVSAVFAVFAVVFWTIVPVSAWHKGILLMWSIWSICSLVIIHVALGMIHPNFDEGTEPERVSTSGQGMAALALSVMLTAAVCYVVYSILTQGTVPLRVWIFFVLLSAGMPMYLLTAAHKSVKEYEF